MKSMTGCGRGQVLENGWEVTVELKAVNHRFLDLALRLPHNLQFLEGMIREETGRRLHRGHVETFINVRHTETADRVVEIDEGLARGYIGAAEKLASVTGIDSRLTMAELLNMEGILRVSEDAMDEEIVLANCKQALSLALDQLDAMRAREGANLAADLQLHLNETAALRGKVVERAPLVVEEYRQKLAARLARLDIDPVEPQRLAQEVALMADRCAVDEELSRLQSHIDQMNSYLRADGEIGKKMDFLIQEMNRETNTIGSKASDAAIARLVVDMKSEIEKLREQIQNVE